MKILALTGSIGMGKSTAAAMLRRMGVPVYCADEAVHRLLGPGGFAVEKIGWRWPLALQTSGGKKFIDRAVLGKTAFHDAALMKELEAILHPLVRMEEKKFLKHARARREKIVVLDIPLWFETGRKNADTVMVVTAPAFVQAQRVLQRPGMTADKLNGILKRQLSDGEKRRRADIIIPTGLGRSYTWKKLKGALHAAA